MIIGIFMIGGGEEETRVQQPNLNQAIESSGLGGSGGLLSRYLKVKAKTAARPYTLGLLFSDRGYRVRVRAMAQIVFHPTTHISKSQEPKTLEN
ncbi:hypothetical protein RRG08_037651 [Elysia crispata]|uniref:Uncharacterized protein n=1 Tax=Elysia crispata TaxID=231223 RepID=A0AAE1CZ59_9GAST|nr:hypothetical protein RRG08_037651 [Elysia crispata]